MHPALQIDEILLNIFCDSQLHPYTVYYYFRQSLRHSDLAALARTCRVFKEPALDVLWSVLADLTPVARCLPEVCYPVYRGSRMYSFRRPLEQAEWDTLRSYTCRIHSVHDFDNTFSLHEAKIFLSPPISGPLFPNLRYLRYVYSGNVPSVLLHQPLPSLFSITFDFEADVRTDSHLLQLEDCLKVITGDPPKIGESTTHLSDPEADPIVSDFICRWSHPQIVSCYLNTLSVDAFRHMSCVPVLTRLSFTLDAALLDRITRFDMLCFDRLQQLELSSKSLIPVSELLSRIRLPAITDLIVRFKNVPSRRDVASFMDGLQTPGTCNSIRTLKLCQSIHFFDGRNSGSDDVLVGNDLRPLMSLTNLRHLDINIKWHVGLVDDDLVKLVSACPRLTQLVLNQDWGWRRNPGGITPDGIIRLLQTGPSLRELALAIDTRSPVEPSLGLDLSRSLSIGIADSPIEVASVPAMVAFLTHLTHLMPSGELSVKVEGAVWLDESMPQCWQNVFTQVEEATARDRFSVDWL